MKEKRLEIRIDEEFLKRLQYLMRLNGLKSLAETIRFVVDKEYRRENHE